MRLVEVLPPLFRAGGPRSHLGLAAALERFTEEVVGIREVADVVLVANVKDDRTLKIDSVQAAAMLKEGFRLDAAPVVVVRDQNRTQFLSTVLTVISLGLSSMMIAWGDDYPASAGVTNVRDFSDLAKALREASLIRSRCRATTRLLAPVDIESLAYPKGVALAKERLRVGADLLLAQPPTTDPEETFDRHASLLESAGLRGKVLPGVFHFKDEADVRRYERMFGWRLPKSLHESAAGGEKKLIDLERKVVRRLRSEGYPGVYLSTRGTPAAAGAVLS